MAPTPLQLKFRTSDTGGDLDLHPDPSDLHACKRSLILLIHGFNSSITASTQAYEAFIALQEELAGEDSSGDFAPDSQIVEIFWKGDDWGVLSALYYPNAIPNAVQTGQALAGLLLSVAAGRGESLQISLVCHSLGARLGLEVVKNLARNPAVEVGHCVFFAAAAATFMLEDPAEPHGLRAALDSILAESRSLYSGHDMVLALAFPPGQTIATGHEGVFPTALGHQIWAATSPVPSLTQFENRGAGHSDYWGSHRKHRDCEQFAGQQAREVLGFSMGAPRQTVVRAIPDRDTADEPILPDRSIPDRSTASRAA